MLRIDCVKRGGSAAFVFVCRQRKQNENNERQQRTQFPTNDVRFYSQRALMPTNKWCLYRLKVPSIESYIFFFFYNSI